MIYQKLTTGMGQCLLLIRKHADRDGFELWRRKERCWCYFNNVGDAGAAKVTFLLREVLKIQKQS